jgi:hypothetical protein
MRLGNMLDPRFPSAKKIFCNSCKQETNHVAQGDYSARVDGEDGWWWHEGVYRLWACAGCESGLLEICWTNVTLTRDDGSQEYTYEYYPKRASHEIEAKMFLRLPQKLQKIYKETIQAFNEGIDLLCTAGLRALLEGICEDKNISGSNLEKKIDALVGLLPKNIVESLHSFRFMGNTAIHELTPPDRADLWLAIEVSEDLLNYFYELDYRARSLSLRQQRKASKVIDSTDSTSGIERHS